MENVQAHDLIWYCPTLVGELHIFKTPLVRLLNLLEVILSLDNTKVTYHVGPKVYAYAYIMGKLCDFW